ncbi:hypothetical protein, partial [Aeromonas veronii]|uniref:hypothetical protein n=1 Tax=Aeromonas veronii TaxID=654 RepID=UPI003D1970DE
NERSRCSGNGVHVKPESVFMIGRNMQRVAPPPPCIGNSHFWPYIPSLCSIAKKRGMNVLRLHISTDHEKRRETSIAVQPRAHHFRTSLQDFPQKFVTMSVEDLDTFSE